MIVVFGEALIDLMPADDPDQWRAMPGGGPANTAVALARLGTPVALACRLSNDAFGRRLRRHLKENGVDLSLAVSATEPSSLAVLGFAGQGVPDFRFYVQGTADWQWTAHELPDRLPPATRALHFGTLASVLPPGAEVLLAWATGHAHATVITYDVNVRPSLLPDRRAYRDRIDAWLRIAHVVKASSDDLRWLHPGRDPFDAARDWIDRYGNRLILITFGAHGATAVSADGFPVHVPSVPVDVADTVGAGDTFTAGVLHSLFAQNSLNVVPPTVSTSAMDRARRFGSAAAAITCTRPGAQPPTAAAVTDLLAQLGDAGPA